MNVASIRYSIYPCRHEYMSTCWGLDPLVTLLSLAIKAVMGQPKSW